MSDNELNEIDSDPEFEEHDFNEVLIQVLGNLFTSDDDNVCSALVKINKNMDTQNKILLKILSVMNSKK